MSKFNDCPNCKTGKAIVTGEDFLEEWYTVGCYQCGDEVKAETLDLATQMWNQKERVPDND